MSRRWRLLLVAGKAMVAALLVAWLLRSDTLDLGALRTLVDEPVLLTAALAVFGFGATVGALRWRGLLRLADVELPVALALRWQLVGVFFSVAVPGNIGGDVVKSVYVARRAPAPQQPVVFLIAFIDRLVGLAGLVIVAVLAILWQGPTAWQPPVRPLAVVIGALAVVTLVLPIALLAAIHRTSDRVARSIDGTTWFARLLARLVAGARLISARPRSLASALAIAVAMHLAGLLLFAALSAAVTRQDAALSTIAAIYPLGMLTLVLPISPAGIGVGHVAFDRLFALAGLHGGATVFNVYLVSQIVPCLLGAIPYVVVRRDAAARMLDSRPDIDAP